MFTCPSDLENKPFTIIVREAQPFLKSSMVILWVSLVVQMVNNLSAMQYTQVQSLGQEIPVEGNDNPLQ